MSSNHESTSHDNIWLGLKYGLAFALVYSAIAVAIVVSGSGPLSTLLMVVAAYFAAGIASGLLLGLFMSKITTRTRAMFLGIVIAYPAMWIIGSATEGEGAGWGQPDLVVVGILAVFFGAWGGWFFGPKPKSKRKRR